MVCLDVGLCKSMSNLMSTLMVLNLVYRHVQGQIMGFTKDAEYIGRRNTWKDVRFGMLSFEPRMPTCRVYEVP